MKTITEQRINRVIKAVLTSPNKSVQRAALWTRLIKLREKIQRENKGYE